MSKKILFMGDIFFHSLEHLKAVSYWNCRIFEPMIQDAIQNNVEITYEIKSDTGEVFDREHFFKLGGINDVKFRYNKYKVDDFNTEQIEYLKKFFNKDVIIIGFELYNKLVDLLSSFGCSIIDFAYHSYKLLDDMFYGINTNNKEVFDKLTHYKVPQEKFYYYANYWKNFMFMQKMIKDDDLTDNCVLFIGQTLEDKSVEKDGLFLNITHFEDKLKEYSEKYSNIYYLPHPYLGKKRKIIYEFCKKSPYITLLNNFSTYGLLASDKVKKVAGISTSVLYEAQYFNKEVEYLYKPLFNIDDTFENKGYISIYEDYWNPKFWADILSPVCEVKQDVADMNFFKGSSNKIRNIEGLYWGYKDLDPIKRIPNFEESVRQIYIKYIAQMF